MPSQCTKKRKEKTFSLDESFFFGYIHLWTSKQKEDDLQYDLVLEGGGKRNAFTSGVLVELARLGMNIGELSRVYAVSSAAHTAAFLVAGQIDLTPRIWVEELNGADIFSFFNPIRGRRLGDVHRLVDYGCRELNEQALDRSTTKLCIVVADLSTGQPLYITCDSSNIRNVLKGTCVVPEWAEPIHLNGKRVVDGGIIDPLPVLQAVKDGSKKLLVISNRPAGFTLKGVTRKVVLPWTMFARYRESRRAFSSELPKRYLQSQGFLENPHPDIKVFTIRPPREVGKLFERNPKRIQEMIDLGMATAQNAWPTLKQFLGSGKTRAQQ